MLTKIRLNANSMKTNTTGGEPEILSMPVEKLPIIEELAVYMRHMDFKNLRELLEFTAPQLLNTPGFTYRCLRDVLELLHQHGCEELLREGD